MPSVLLPPLASKTRSPCKTAFCCVAACCAAALPGKRKKAPVQDCVLLRCCLLYCCFAWQAQKRRPCKTAFCCVAALPGKRKKAPVQDCVARPCCPDEEDDRLLSSFFLFLLTWQPASSRWSSFADVLSHLSPAQRSLCSAAAAPRSMGQRSVENGQHGHTVDSTVPCRARRPGLIADQLHIHSLCRRRCWRELALHVFDQCSLDSGLP